MPRDPEKLANARATYYYRHRTKLLAKAAARYVANRQDRIDYQCHYRSVVRETFPVVKQPGTRHQRIGRG